MVLDVVAVLCAKRKKSEPVSRLAQNLTLHYS